MASHPDRLELRPTPQACRSVLGDGSAYSPAEWRVDGGLDIKYGLTWTSPRRRNQSGFGGGSRPAIVNLSAALGNLLSLKNSSSLEGSSLPPPGSPSATFVPGASVAPRGDAVPPGGIVGFEFRRLLPPESKGRASEAPDWRERRAHGRRKRADLGIRPDRGRANLSSNR